MYFLKTKQIKLKVNLGIWTDNILSFNSSRYSETLKRVVTFALDEQLV